MNSGKVLQKQIDALDTTKPNLTKIREIANEYRKNRETAMHLWKHGGTPRGPQQHILEVRRTSK